MSDKKTDLKQLRKGEKLTGRITRIKLYGAFVDVGLDHEGLIHISRLKRGRTNRVEETVQPGQDVETWVHRISQTDPRLELTMIRPVELRWSDIKPGKELNGKVVRVENYGAFVDIGAERPGLVHVSEMSNDYVQDPSKVVSPGDEISVSVLEVDRKKKQIRLSMRIDETVSEEEQESEIEEIPTAMEVALRIAMEDGKSEDPSLEPSQYGPAGKRKDLDDILARTLATKPETRS
jgi:ribosomal protein S1